MKVKNSHKPVVVNHRTKTIVVTNSFMRAATDPSSAEFEMYMKLTAECPDYKVVYTKPRKVKKDDRPPKLTYKRMEKYISCLRDADELLALFEKVKAFAKSQPNAYLTVSRWFYSSFPDYGCQPDFDADGFPLVEVNVIPIEEYQQKRSMVEQFSASSQREQTEVKQEQAS